MKVLVRSPLLNDLSFTVFHSKRRSEKTVSHTYSTPITARQAQPLFFLLPLLNSDFGSLFSVSLTLSNSDFCASSLLLLFLMIICNLQKTNHHSFIFLFDTCVGAFYSYSPSARILTTTQKDIHFFLFNPYCSCRRLCKSGLHLILPILSNRVLFIAGLLTSRRNYCIWASGPTFCQIYFHAISGLRFITVFLTLTVLPLDSCSHTLVFEKSSISSLFLFSSVVPELNIDLHLSFQMESHSTISGLLSILSYGTSPLLDAILVFIYNFVAKRSSIIVELITTNCTEIDTKSKNTIGINPAMAKALLLMNTQRFTRLQLHLVMEQKDKSLKRELPDYCRKHLQSFNKTRLLIWITNKVT